MDVIFLLFAIMFLMMAIMAKITPSPIASKKIHQNTVATVELPIKNVSKMLTFEPLNITSSTPEMAAKIFIKPSMSASSHKNSCMQSCSMSTIYPPKIQGDGSPSPLPLHLRPSQRSEV